MRKVLFFLFLFIVSPFLTACDRENAVIAFSSTPFSREKGYTPKNIFKTGEKIYFAVYNPKEFKTRLLKLQVFKKENDKTGGFWGFEYLYNRTLELKNKTTYTDYIVINNKGTYVFQIFDYTDFQEPVVMGTIKVDEN